jgi:phage terminase small subunit
MGKMTREEVVDVLESSNQHPRQFADTRLYADMFLEYMAAQANIAEHGTIVSHPRTGAPIDNPYLRIRDKARDAMQKMKLDASDLWAEWEEMADGEDAA